MAPYNPHAIEKKWQAFWEQNKTFATPRLPDGEKLYVLDMFPYPSGSGLHVGHPEGYTATDIVCRYARMNGKCVIHPMGWDAFGLPAEQHAKKTGTHPRTTTEKNINNFRRQLKMLGFSYDWDREIATTDRDYFRWTQWIFLVLFDTWFDPATQTGRPIDTLPIPDDVNAEGKDAVEEYRDEHRLAYQQEATVNWCPALGTVLANEEVINGLSDRGDHPVVRLPLRQWMLRITAYADRLENDLSEVQWPDSIKKLQSDWIGRSTGAEVDFWVGDTSERSTNFEEWKSERTAKGFPRKPDTSVIRVYTTRPDTLYGATYMVLAPEHPYVGRLTTPDQLASVQQYCEQASRKSDLDRTDLAKEKSGVFTGSHAINPVNGNAVPIWIADYVLMGYGTGAIMAVPAHDTRDFEFAKQFDLPILAVVQELVQEGSGNDSSCPEDGPFVGQGRAINSGHYDGTQSSDLIAKISADLSDQGLGNAAVNYKLRDWLFSRQHFWGEPFPIIHELDESGEITGRIRAIDPCDLPLDLPEVPNFTPTGSAEPPLEQAPKEWLYPTINGRKYKRETNTMPQWAGSCWYYLRFLDPKNSEKFVDPIVERAWMPVDLYIGGAEHAVLHLLYARFWHKVLLDRGHVTTAEPFQRLVNQGMILGEVELSGFKKETGEWVSANAIERCADRSFVTKSDQVPVAQVRVPQVQSKKLGEKVVMSSDESIQLECRANKMSKSRGNVINPDDVVASYGADSLRLYEMFMGPLEATKPWSMQGVEGVNRFLKRAWRMIVDDRLEPSQLDSAVQGNAPNEEHLRVLHRTIQIVTEDFERLRFNTAISRLMEFVNFFSKEQVRPRDCMEKFVLLVSPLAPHFAEELWHVMGHTESLAYEPWPTFDSRWTQEDTVELPVQINGKVRSRVSVAVGASAQELEEIAKKDEKIQALLSGKTVQRVIVVPNRLVNIVAR